jgi:uncharacterized protein YbcI
MSIMDPGGASVYRVAGRTYPLKSQPGCGVCRSKYRTMVENMLCTGLSAVKVVEEMELMAPPEDRLKVHQIRNHLTKGHIPHIEEIKRKIIERRLTEMQVDPDQAADHVIDHIGFLRLVVNEAVDDLLNRNLKVKTVTEALQAVNLLDRIEGVTGPSVTDMQLGISIIMRTVKANTSKAQYAQISKDLLAEPHILMLMGRQVPTEQNQETVADEGYAEIVSG